MPRMRRAWQRVRAFLARVRDLFPLTLLGVLVAAGSAWALFHWGLRRIDLLLLVIGIVGLGLAALCTLIAVVSAVVIFFRFRKRASEDALKLECGFPGRTGFSVGSPWFVPFLRIGWTWTEPEAHVRQHRRGLRLHEEVTPIRRALHDTIVRRFEVSDSFGLTRITFSLRESRDVRFHPSVGALKQMHVVSSMAAGEDMPHPAGPPEGERADMRHYVAGDPIKYVLWKVFARSREVVVRTPERAIGPVNQTVAYMVSGEDDEPAAGTARMAVDTGALGGDWVLGADGTDEYAYSKHQALEVLARSSRAEDREQGAGLGKFLREATPGGPGRALVFVPATPGPWLDRVVAAVRSAGRTASVEFVVCTDGIEKQKAGSLLSRLAMRKETKLDPRKGIGATSRDDVIAVCRKLASARARVLVVDRVRGHVWSEAHLPKAATTEAVSDGEAA